MDDRLSQSLTTRRLEPARYLQFFVHPNPIEWSALAKMVCLATAGTSFSSESAAWMRTLPSLLGEHRAMVWRRAVFIPLHATNQTRA